MTLDVCVYGPCVMLKIDNRFLYSYALGNKLESIAMVPSAQDAVRMVPNGSNQINHIA